MQAKLKVKALRTYFASFSIAAATAFALNAEAGEVSLNRQGDEVQITSTVQADFAGSEATISAPDAATVEVHIPGADFSIAGDSKRQLFRFEDQEIKTVSLTKDGNGGILRFNLKAKNATAVADQLSITRGQKAIYIAVPIAAVTDEGAAPLGVKTISIAPAAATTASGETAASAPTKLTVKETAAPETTTKTTAEPGEGAAATTSEATTEVFKSAPPKPESEIPVLVDQAAGKKSASVGIERLVMTLFVICALLAATLFGLKKWTASRKNHSSIATKIQVLTTHHLGPKKSIAIIQVAGEAILIGITDQNISMLKTLALIDDEVPGVVPKNFSDELDQDGFVESEEEATGDEPEENFAMTGLNQVRDIVNTRFQLSGRDGRSRGKNV